MKKTYQIPEIEVTQMESTELMEASMGPWSDESVTNPNNILSRDIIFDDEE